MTSSADQTIKSGMSFDSVLDGRRLLAAGGAIHRLDGLVGFGVDHHFRGFRFCRTFLLGRLGIRVAAEGGGGVRGVGGGGVEE